MTKIKALFVDIGGVFLTNGWDHHSREQAAELFGLDFDEIEKRHFAVVELFEVGKLTLHEYLQWVVFDKKRSFSMQAYEKFMYAQSKAYPDMIKLISKLKEKHHLKIVVVSNESRELTEYRINKFKLDQFVDFFVSSCFVHLRKPDEAIFRMALDLAHVESKEVLYIDDRAMYVEAAKGLGIKGIVHKDAKTTSAKLKKQNIQDSHAYALG